MKSASQNQAMNVFYIDVHKQVCKKGKKPAGHVLLEKMKNEFYETEHKILFDFKLISKQLICNMMISHFLGRKLIIY